MRIILLLAAFMLAGCSGAATESLDVGEAETIRSQAKAAMGPNGSLREMTGSMVMEMTFDEEPFHMEMDFDARLYSGDSFAMDATMTASAEFGATGAMHMLCTPETLVFETDFGGESQRLESSNDQGTCLHEGAVGLAGLLGAFDGLEGFEDSGLGNVGFAPESDLPYTTATRQGDTVTAQYVGQISESGFAMSYDGIDTYRGGLLRSSNLDMTASAFGMSLQMDLQFDYGQRSAAPTA